MAEFKINYSCRVIPTETITFTDTTQSCKRVNTQIDKTFGGGTEKSYGTDPSKMLYKESYNTTLSSVLASHSSIFNVSTNIDLLYIKIKKALGASVPVVNIRITHPSDIAGISFQLRGVGDAMCIPVVTSTTYIGISSPGATQVAEIELFAGDVEV